MTSVEWFVTALSERMALSGVKLNADTTFDELPTDRAFRAYFYRALSELLRGPPGELVRSITSVREAYEWYLQRSIGCEESVLEPQRQRVFLRPLEESDHRPLYYAAIRPESAFRWRFRGATPSLERFVGGLHDGVLVQHMVQSTDGQVVGLVVAYNASLENRSAFFGFLRTAPLPVEGRMFEGLMLFLRFLFETWDFRKLYAEVPEYNFTGILDPSTRGIDVEGVMRQHLFHDGKWWDQYLISLWRNRWEHEQRIWFGED